MKFVDFVACLTTVRDFFASTDVELCSCKWQTDSPSGLVGSLGQAGGLRREKVELVESIETDRRAARKSSRHPINEQQQNRMRSARKALFEHCLLTTPLFHHLARRPSFISAQSSVDCFTAILTSDTLEQTIC